jgi:hypothetical protein
MGKAKKAHRAKIAQRNLRIKQEQAAIQKWFAGVNEANGVNSHVPKESIPQMRMVTPGTFLPLTGSEGYNPNRDLDILYGGKI